MQLLLASVTHDTNGVINGTIAFRSMIIKMKCNMTFFISDTIATSDGPT